MPRQVSNAEATCNEKRRAAATRTEDLCRGIITCAEVTDAAYAKTCRLCMAEKQQGGARWKTCSAGSLESLALAVASDLT